jgi:prepilin-type N-terminal cleavage/methylation domain-containing protein
MRTDHGFTLLEVSIAFTIAALAVVALLRGAGSGLSAAHTAGLYEEGVSRAQSHLAALGKTVHLASGESDGDDGDNFHWHLKIVPVATAAPAEQTEGPPRPVFPNGALLYAVVIEETWRDGGVKRSFILRSERLGPLAETTQ